jgi:hypothetical protein
MVSVFGRGQIVPAKKGIWGALQVKTCRAALEIFWLSLLAHRPGDESELACHIRQRKSVHLMINAIQTVPSAYSASQIISSATAFQRASQAKSLEVLASTMVSLGATKTAPLTYNATGSLDTTTPSLRATVATQDSAANDASTLADNSTVLDKALADSLAKQILINARIIAAGLATLPAGPLLADSALAGTANSSETNRLIAIASQAIATNSARTLDDLLAANISLSKTEKAASIGEENVAKTERAATPLLPTLLTQSVAQEPVRLTSTTPATTTNVVATSNATTNSLSRTAEIVNLPAGNTTTDTTAQAVANVAQNPAYLNLVAGYYSSMAASATQPPSGNASPIRFDEVKPVNAISAITALSQLGGQSGRDGNPASGYQQRRTNSMRM